MSRILGTVAEDDDGGALEFPGQQWAQAGIDDGVGLRRGYKFIVSRLGQQG